MTAQTQSTTTKKLKIFTAEEVELHNKEDTAYISVRNNAKQRTEVFNVTRFLDLHPGGKSILMKHAGKDVTNEFYSSTYHAHSEKAERMLQNYLVGVIADEKNDLNTEIEGVTLHHFQNLIDWKHPVLAQIMALKDPKMYQVWLHNVHNPHKTITLFTTQFLEDYFTHWPWWYVLVWIPISMYAFSLSLQYNNMDIIKSVILFVLGMFSWTFAEYLIHRFLFHLDTSSHIGNFYHFFAHGIHHLTPLDGQRLTFPPTFSFVVGTTIFFGTEKFLTPSMPSSMAFAGGFALGYMLYDVLHYMFHHGPEWVCNIRYVQLMKTRHMMHHYSDPNLNFGVSSPVFDFVFGTNDTAKL